MAVATEIDKVSTFSPMNGTIMHIFISSALDSDRPEIEYTWSVLVNALGKRALFHSESQSAPYPDEFDVALGSFSPKPAKLQVDAHFKNYLNLAKKEPDSFIELDQLCFLNFDNHPFPTITWERNTKVNGDITFTCFWCLSGLWEKGLSKDSKGDLDVTNSFWVKEGLWNKAPVSQCIAFLKRVFNRGAGHSVNKNQVLFPGILVDKPNVYKSLALPRLLHDKGLSALPTLGKSLMGKSHFWNFNKVYQWLRGGTTSGQGQATFFFNARPAKVKDIWNRKDSPLELIKGMPNRLHKSLLQYGVHKHSFQKEFELCRQNNCEVALQSTILSIEDPGILKKEKAYLEYCSGLPVSGHRLESDLIESVNELVLWETLSKTGFHYDSSLSFAQHPGWRRGIIEAFHPYNMSTRKAFDIQELCPAWTDEHFARKLSQNHLDDAGLALVSLLNTALKLKLGTSLVLSLSGFNPDYFPDKFQWFHQSLNEYIEMSEVGEAELLSQNDGVQALN